MDNIKRSLSSAELFEKLAEPLSTNPRVINLSAQNNFNPTIVLVPAMTFLGLNSEKSQEIKPSAYAIGWRLQESILTLFMVSSEATDQPEKFRKEGRLKLFIQDKSIGTAREIIYRGETFAPQSLPDAFIFQVSCDITDLSSDDFQYLLRHLERSRVSDKTISHCLDHDFSPEAVARSKTIATIITGVSTIILALVIGSIVEKSNRNLAICRSLSAGRIPREISPMRRLIVGGDQQFLKSNFQEQRDQCSHNTGIKITNNPYSEKAHSELLKRINLPSSFESENSEKPNN